MKVVIAGGGVAALETLLALRDHRERAIARALDRDGAGKRRGRLGSHGLDEHVVVKGPRIGRAQPR
jgi:hypothetical protein